MKKIAIIGATGMIGIPVTKELVKSGFDIAALVRDVEKAKGLFPKGVRFVKGDLADKNSIAETLKGAEGLYLNISIAPENKEADFNPESEGLDNILETAKKNNLKQIIYLSSFLSRNYKGNWWVMKTKQEAVKKIKNSGIPYTVFYPSNFMENFRGGMAQGKKIVSIGKSDHKLWWIAGKDFGKQVASAFKTRKSINKEYAVQGLESMTMSEAIDVYVKNYSAEKLGVSNLPMPMAKFLALFISPLKSVTRLMEVMNHNVEIFESQNTWDELGKPETTLAEFAKK